MREYPDWFGGNSGAGDRPCFHAMLLPFSGLTSVWASLNHDTAGRLCQESVAASGGNESIKHKLGSDHDKPLITGRNTTEKDIFFRLRSSLSGSKTML
jgi:hypothetical protein